MGRRKKKKKTMTLSEIGFAMKHEASKTKGDVMFVSKALWLDIAEILMETDRNLLAIEKELKGWGAEDGCQMDKDHNGCF